MIDTLHDTVIRAYSMAAEAWTQVSALASDHPLITFQAFTIASIFALTRAGSSI